MTRRLSLVSLAAAIAGSVLVFAGCSTTESRISSHPEIYQSLRAGDQALVSQGRIREGMPENAVWLSWGAPDQRLAGRMQGQSAETWIYTSSYEPYPGPRFGYGLGYGYGFYGGGGFYRHRGRYVYRNFGYYDPFFDDFYYSNFNRVSYPYKTVSFQGGRVVGYQFLAPPR